MQLHWTVLLLCEQFCNLWLFKDIVVLYALYAHCTHVRFSYVINFYLLTYLYTHDLEWPFCLVSLMTGFVQIVFLMRPGLCGLISQWHSCWQSAHARLHSLVMADSDHHWPCHFRLKVLKNLMSKQKFCSYKLSAAQYALELEAQVIRNGVVAKEAYSKTDLLHMGIEVLYTGWPS